MTAKDDLKALEAIAWAMEQERISLLPATKDFRSEGPQPLLRAIPPGAVYPVHALGPLTDAVRAVQGMTQAPMAIPAQSALAVASLAVQGFADVEMLGGGFSPPSLYCLTIAQSGERKSSCDKPLMAALREYEREQARTLRDAMTKWHNAQALWKGEREQILAQAKKGKGANKTAAQADLNALGPEPIAPPSTDRTVTEPTFEGLTRLFAEGQPSLGIFSDEGGQFIGGHAMNSDNRLKTLAALNDLWQGNPIRRTRAGEGHTTLYGRRLAVHLMAQPGVVRAFIDEDEPGEDRAGVVVEGILVQQIRVSAFRNVVLEGTLVVFLLVGRDADGKHVRTRTGAFEAGERFVASPRRAGVEDESDGGRIAERGGFVDLNDAGDFVESLDGDVIELRILSGGQVVEGDGEAGLRVIRRAEDVHDADLRTLAGDDQRVWKDDGVFTGDPMMDFDGAFDLDLVGNVDEQTVR